ncbi:MAG: ABC transporter ATP-binding protein [Planctomycetes bacterium]|nr:ABC transporter ATP-binding protein [Planctomycetota bacterium]
MVETATEIAVSCVGVTKTYGEGQSQVTALRGIDLEVRQGELLMLVGPSGCGKTTLISVIAAILDHDAGEVRVFGEDLREMSSSRRTRFRGENIGFVFQQFNLIPTLTIAENVAVPLLIAGVRRSEAVRRGRALLDRVGIGDRWNTLPSKLSGGQQQRVAIARSLVHNPRLIVCDEPTSSLDHETGHKVMELMREVAAGADRALVVVTHDARIFEFADRIARMDDGRILSVTKGGPRPPDARERGTGPH